VPIGEFLPELTSANAYCRWATAQGWVTGRWKADELSPGGLTRAGGEPRRLGRVSSEISNGFGGPADYQQ